MKLARSLGVSHRRLMGWEATETVEHVYDDDGRLIRSVITREPEWTVEQVNLALASQQVDAETRPHGYMLRDALDPATEDMVEVEAVTDHIQAAIDKFREKFQEEHEGAPMHGIEFVASLRR